MAIPLLMLVMLGFLVGGTVSSIGIICVSVFDAAARIWTMPVVLYVCYGAVYVLGRFYVSRGVLTAPFLRAVVISSGWFSVTTWMTFAVTGAIANTPISGFVPSGRISLAWLLVVIAAGMLLANRHRALS